VTWRGTEAKEDRNAILALAARKQLLGKVSYMQDSVVYCVSSPYERCFTESCMLVLIFLVFLDRSFHKPWSSESRHIRAAKSVILEQRDVVVSEWTFSSEAGGV